ncbi:hypothetical protein K402DRAFT_414700 [Aulographum hederae CBS 113979]|uniref:Uncharacterized protein n=1 Tax=Aulographum hederae CBS 113979 TaxID=1176131 RepID=A0A6G1GPR8_9PEZI|nr:hypothetical protein K402DRAFT_414700 [Aulographum hederae CBS 113979]
MPAMRSLLPEAIGSDATPPVTKEPVDVETEVQRAQELGKKILNSHSVVKEGTVVAALKACESAAALIVAADRKQSKAKPLPAGDEGKTTTAASALLSLDERPPLKLPPSLSVTVELLSKLAYEILLHPPVYISPSILAYYINTQSLLQRPSSFPEIFTLYAAKPAPDPSSQSVPPTYKPQDPSAASAAIPEELANRALNSAIQTKNLPLSLEIIEASFGQTAFQKAKFLRKALTPLSVAGLTPIAAYSLASHFSAQQAAMDESTFTMYAMAGIMTYVTCVGSIGMLALLTANDQMVRVTYMKGLPLRVRWLREEERAAIDRVAMSFGFSSEEKFGEESTSEWEILDEWCREKQLVLDAVELMDGME